MTPARTSSQPEQREPLYLYDGQVLLGIVDRVHGQWRAVVHGCELGLFGSHEEALAALHEAIDSG